MITSLVFWIVIALGVPHAQPHHNAPARHEMVLHLGGSGDPMPDLRGPGSGDPLPPPGA